ncbi:type II toxin-antitoxin system Phd/YefM family antitoxin [Micromonospora carbonacea]|uniref:Antitoxin Phd_YefM, type II toxin-antitoxin system n=1 Tax=Micromonospora carbonacea TaxID=47853 RepID=A0A1C5ACF7_9ACTN|nr:type II toxin-antitoxin system Phd/YefM family antitoxin [Micromonospora carbonacea]SCF42942.1 Antitoxin Phd_YefM, type II toxin-antitoxin system [Micromonospora carbonacea]
MNVMLEANPYETPGGDLYDSGVAKVEPIQVEEARKNLGKLLEQAEESGTHFALSKYGKTKGFFVPTADYRRYRELDGDPTDL